MQLFDQGRPVIPRHSRRSGGEIVAESSRKRDWSDREPTEICGKSLKYLGDFEEPALLEGDEVHLVDGEDQVTNAQQRADEGVPFGLGQHALARIDQDHRQAAIRGGGRHVAGVLLVPRRIGDHERPLWCRKEPVRHIDRYPLLPLVFEPVQQQREIEGFSGRAETPGTRAQGWRADRLGSARSRRAGGRSRWICRRRPIRKSGTGGGLCQLARWYRIQPPIQNFHHPPPGSPERAG